LEREPDGNEGKGKVKGLSQVQREKPSVFDAIDFAPSEGPIWEKKGRERKGAPSAGTEAGPQ